MFRAEATTLRSRGGGGFLCMFLGPPGADRVISACAQVYEDVVKITHHIVVGAERRHDVFLGGAYVLSAARNDGKKVAIAQCFKRVPQRRRVSRTHAIRSMANMTIGMIA